MTSKHRWLWALLAVAAMQSAAAAEVKLPSIFSEHMVVQREQPVPVWGWAEPGEKVKVSLAGQSAETKADEKGNWKVALPELKAGGPYELVVAGSNTIKRGDVLVGEVWLCSGQSNMGWTVARSVNAKEEIANSANPKLRMFFVARHPADKPQENCRGDWRVAGPKTVGNFSAVAYFFGRKLQKELGVPVGLINSSWGGTICEAWTSHEALQGEDDFKALLKRGANSKNKKSPNRASVLYNGMIAPLVPYGIRGAIWYQGEANVGRAAQYAKLFPTMIRDWRDQWNEKFPFLFVQLAPFRYGNHDPALCAELWDAQLKTLKNVENTGMAVTTDIATLNNIHPPNKQDVGDRLARWALAKTYGKDGIVYSGPIYKSMKVEGNKIRLAFNHVDGGLKTRDGKAPNEFQIASAKGDFVPAQAKIEGDAVVVWSDQVSQPAAVRMGWRDTAQPNLMNEAGLPASPFRTDDRKLKTAGRL